MTNERRKSHDQIKYKPNSYESSKIEPSGQLFFAVLKEIFLCRFCDIDDNTSNRRIAIDYNGDPVSYTHPPSPRDLSTSRMPSSA